MTQIHKRAVQRGFEFQTWIALCRHFEVESYLEIGVEHGWTLEYAQRYLLDAKVLGVDCAPQLESRIPPTSVVIGSSTDLATIDKIFTMFGRRWPEAVFIDGDHGYVAARNDWLHWGEKARLCAFHDVNTWSLGCAKLWRDLKGKHRSLEIFAGDEESRQRWESQYGKLDGFGIGVIFRDDPQGEW